MWQFAFIGLAASVQGVPAAAQPDWRWQSNGAGCVLRQQIDAAIQFEIGRTPGNDTTRVTLFDRQGTGRDWKPLGSVIISLEPGGGIQADGYVGPADEPNGRIITLSVTDGALLRQLSTASVLTLSNPKLGNVRITPRSLGAAIKSLAECEDRKMRKWGVDPIAWRALAVKPTPKSPPATWINWFDYPDRAKQYSNDITVVARLDLSDDGSVQGCEVVNVPPSEFRDAACKALKRNARLLPGRDASGRGAPAPFVVQIQFGAFKI